MSLPFHPVVSRWFTETLGEPTPAQRRGWAAIRRHRHTLIAAPTGSGKTLAAFLSALDDLFQEGVAGRLPDEVRVLYVSPLKALSADIHRNLAEPRAAIRRLARESGIESPRITAAVRTGDTPQSERAAMIAMPPHILVTTPESLYLLLTAERSRAMLRTVRTVIVDEIHAVIGSRRGAHLALSLERLQQVTERPVVRLGLSATQTPVEEVARFLVGSDRTTADGAADCEIVDEGHRRRLDLALELPRSPVEAVMSNEVWEEYYDRIAELVRRHRTTLVFVNTRRLAERVARHLSERLGEEAVTAHHGSLSKEKRLDAETRLKDGRLQALVATSSLELGIDIGHVDLVCQVGSPRVISTVLQRVGRSGHTVGGTSKGRLFPTSRDDLVECAALLRAVKRGELDRLSVCEGPLDVLAQQIVAETACQEYDERDLHSLMRRAYPYRELSRDRFARVLGMLGEGFVTRRGRRAALVHRDEVNGRVAGRRGARLTALTSGGAIPEIADYRVVLDPGDVFIGTLNEDFAIESAAGDVFQLGNTSWRILQVAGGTVRVADAHGQPPTIPFWFGEAPGRSAELSRAVSEVRRHIDERLARASDGARLEPVIAWLGEECGVSTAAAEQIAAYLDEARRALGTLPTTSTIVLERFFDESGGMQLVLHAPFGSRVNRAWGLALRKKFCRQFNFELQAAATEEALLLSLGPQHSFPLADVFRYLHPATLRDVLVQALLDSPMFETRWRWNTTIALAVPRSRHGQKVPPQIQRMMADDLLAAAFPDAAACLENIPGDRQIPDHPLVTQTIHDCLHEAMDLDRLSGILSMIHDRTIACVARDTTEPSPLAHEILNARPYSFLDDAPLEERRTHAVYTRRATDPKTARDLGALDADAVARVAAEAWPDPRDAAEMHDALMTLGVATDGEASSWKPLMDALRASGRATRVLVSRGGDGGGIQPAMWVAAERLPELAAVHRTTGRARADLTLDPAIEAPPARRAREWSSEAALVELLRGRLSCLGPVTARELAEVFAVPDTAVDAALLALEADGAILRGTFTPDGDADPLARPLEWCDRTLLARIHRYTLNRLRAEIEPVSPSDYMRFLFGWQHVSEAHRLSGIDGLRAAMAGLDGFEAAAGAWERAILPARVADYAGSMLDMLCLTGEVGWARLSPGGSDRAQGAGDKPSGSNGAITGSKRGARGTRSSVVGSTPVAFFLREHLDVWRHHRPAEADATSEARAHRESALSDLARMLLGILRQRGASFARELASRTSAAPGDVREALAELVSAGLVTADGFAGLRVILGRGGVGRHGAGLDRSGRWSLVGTEPGLEPRDRFEADSAVEAQARVLLRRYGVMCRRLLTREPNAAPWRDLLMAYRRLEARGEIRGGRFVSGLSGEQFALADAVAELRIVRRTPPSGALATISAADPLNLSGIVTAGERIAAVASTRIVYRDGVAVAVSDREAVRPLVALDESLAGAIGQALRRRVASARGPAAALVATA
jgi:ATP-dependent Lhr-like helicase